MTNRMLDIFIRNQLSINVDYEGEMLTINGAQIDLTKRTYELRKDFNIPSHDILLDMYVAYICNNTSIKLNSQGNTFSLPVLLEQFKYNFPPKLEAEKTVNTLYQVIGEEFDKNVCDDKFSVIGTSLFVRNYSRTNFKLALNHLFGLNKYTRFIQNTDRVRNGNFLDLYQSNLQKMADSCLNFSTPCNMLRSTGYPYSDYRKYIHKDMLVSIDILCNVYVIKDDILYCINLDKFKECLSDDFSFDRFSKFEREFVLESLTLDHYIRLENLV